MKKVFLTGFLTLSFFVSPIHAATTDNTALIQKLLAQITVLQSELAKLRGTTMTPPCTFTRLLVKGTQGTDVTCLQDFLKSKGHFQGTATGLFGPMTEVAVTSWQKAEGIVAEPWEYGHFGEQSRVVYAKDVVVFSIKQVEKTDPVLLKPAPVAAIPKIKTYTPKEPISFATQVPITVTTDIPTTCRYGMNNELYNALPQNFAGINTLEHSASVALPEGTTEYQYYVRCITSGGVESVKKKIEFRVKATTTPEIVPVSTTPPAQQPPVYSLPPLPRIWRMGFYWPLTSKSYPPDFIPWSKYTHVSEMQIMPTDSCGINDTTYKVKDSQGEFIRAGHAAGVRMLVTLGDSKSGKYLEKCTETSNIDAFVTGLKNYVVSNQYDGLDVDWEDSFVPTQYKNFIVKLRVAMPSYTLTTDIGVYQRNAVAEVQDKLDRINLMSYDMHTTDYSGSRLKDTWYNTAVFSANDTQSHKSAEADLYYLLASHIAPGKINLGLPFYGYEVKGCQESLTLEGVCVHKITAPFQPVSNGSLQITQITYAEVLTKYPNVPSKWDAVRGAPYISTEDSFITYSDPQQMKSATQFLLDRGLGGVMTFSLFQEYISTETGDSRYPLSSAIYETLQSRSALSASLGTFPLTSSETQRDILQDLLLKLKTLEAKLNATK